MSEKDLALKLAARRLAWHQGYATKVNVPLRSYVERRSGRPGHEEYTDLDVLAVAITPVGDMASQIFDCKSTSSRTTERVFWLRGVADFFGIDHAWMLRQEAVTDASRQLASRLNLGVVTKEDLDVLDQIASRGVPPYSSGVERLFDASVIEKMRSSRSSLAKGLRNLTEYLNYDYWVYDRYQNLTQLIAHVRSAAPNLQGNNAVHCALLFDCIWLFAHSLAGACRYARTTNAAQPYEALREYTLGGQVAIREKQARLAELQRLAPESAPKSIEPDWFDALADVFVRVYVRPTALTNIMRYAEVASANFTDSRRPYLTSALGEEYEPVSAKLMNDVGQFIIASARLSPSFRDTVSSVALAMREDQNQREDGEGKGEVSPQI